MSKLRIFERNFSQVCEIILTKENQFLSKVIHFFCHQDNNNENPKNLVD